MVMGEGAGGTLLSDLVTRGQGLPEAEARWFFLQILFCLEYIHRMVSLGVGQACLLPCPPACLLAGSTGGWVDVRVGATRAPCVLAARAYRHACRHTHLRLFRVRCCAAKDTRAIP